MEYFNVIEASDRWACDYSHKYGQRHRANVHSIVDIKQRITVKLQRIEFVLIKVNLNSVLHWNCGEVVVRKVKFPYFNAAFEIELPLLVYIIEENAGKAVALNTSTVSLGNFFEHTHSKYLLCLIHKVVVWHCFIFSFSTFYQCLCFWLLCSEWENHFQLTVPMLN